MERPLIGLDGYNLALEQGTGVATYARSLSHSLSSLGAEVGVLYGRPMARAPDPLLREATFFDPRTRLPRSWRRTRDVARVLRLLAGTTRALEVPISDAVLRAGLETRLPRADRFWTVPDLFRAATLGFGVTKRFGRVELPQRPLVMHWTYPLPLRVPGSRNIYTIHDMVPLRLPYATLDNKRRHLRMLRRIAAEADHVVTVSESARRDIIALLGVPEERVTNTYQAVEVPARLAARPEAMVRAELEGGFGLRWGEYFLFLGAIEPKKNVGRLIEAYLASGSTRPLVIAGRQAWGTHHELGLLYEDDRRTLEPDGPIEGVQGLARRLRDRILLLDYVPFRLLVGLLRGARALLFPSLYEGFGLPVLEAMQLGTPVLTADTASLPEVAGDAALLVDPYDTRAIAEGIAALDRDDALRADYAVRGPRQAALFGPEAYGRRLQELYRRLGVVLPG